MTETVAQIAQSLSAATTPAGSPASMAISRPSKESAWTLYGALGSSWLIAAAAIYMLTIGHWPTDASTTTSRIAAIGSIGVLSMICQLVVIAALGGSKLGHIQASAAGATVEVDGAPPAKE